MWPYLALRGQVSARDPQNQRAFWSLRDVSFSVNRGEVIGILGANGAGKSTLLKILSRIIAPTCGSAVIRGRVSSLLEVGTGFNPNLTGRENIFLNAALHGLNKREIASRLDAIIEFAGIDRFVDTPVKRYSSGMYSRLAFSVAAHIEPEVLFVDEVLSVGDLAFQQKCLNAFSAMVGGMRTVLFVSHNLSAVSNICSKVLWLDRGEVRFFGPTEAGIAAYYAASIPAQSQELDARHDRLGSGEFRFDEIGFKNVDLSPCAEIRSGEPLIIELKFHMLSSFVEPIRDLNIAVVFKNDKGHRIFSTPSDVLPGPLPSSLPTSGSIFIKIPSLPLVPGIYDLDVGCIINRTTMDKLVSAKRITVSFGDYYQSGRLPPQQMGDALIQFDFSIHQGASGA